MIIARRPFCRTSANSLICRGKLAMLDCGSQANPGPALPILYLPVLARKCRTARSRSVRKGEPSWFTQEYAARPIQPVSIRFERQPSLVPQFARALPSLFHAEPGECEAGICGSDRPAVRPMPGEPGGWRQAQGFRPAVQGQWLQAKEVGLPAHSAAPLAPVESRVLPRSSDCQQRQHRISGCRDSCNVSSDQ
jgi:hypothetical protein